MCGGGITRGSEKSYYTTDNGYYLVMVSEDGVLEFDSDKMDLSKGDTVTVGKFSNENDFVITYEEHSKNNVRQISEEYYYVDFNSEEFKDLDKTDIVIRQTYLSSTNTKVCIITDKYGTDIGYNDALDYTGENGIGILQSFSSYPNSYMPPTRIHVVSPIDIKVGDSDKKLTELFSVIRLKADSADENKEYCLVIKGVDESAISALTSNRYFQKTLLRNVYGDNSGKVAIPYYSSTDNTITYYIGTLPGDLMLDINFESFYTNLESINYEISLIEKPDTIPAASTFTDITSADGSEVVLSAPYSSSDYLTVPYKSTRDERVRLYAKLNDISSYGFYAYVNDKYSGNGSRSIGTTIDAFDVSSGLTGYFLIKLKNQSVKSGDNVVISRKVAVEKAEVGKVYTFDKDELGYVSKDRDIVVDGVEMMANAGGKDFRAGTFKCNSTEKALKDLSIVDGYYNYNGTSFAHCSHDYSFNAQYCFGGYREDDPSITYIFYVDEFNYSSATNKSIKGNMVLIKAGNEIGNYEGVSFVWTE